MDNLQQVHWHGIPGLVKRQRNERMQTWETLNYGMFIHWGLYSELGGVWQGEPVTKGYSEQIQMWANIPEADYLKVAENFAAEAFDADEICELAKAAGMKYVLMTTKHHDGFCMFDTKTTDYNIVQKTPYGKDPLKQLSDACARHGLKFGIYYSLVDWHQGHEFDENNNNPIPDNIEKLIEAQLEELLNNYGDICEIWFDMSSPTVAQSQMLIDIVRKYQPQAAINSRIWNNMGDFRTLDDNEVPSVTLDGSWQTPASIYNETWGYRAWQERDDLDGKVKELLKAFVGDGNYLLNIGPRGDGSIVSFEAEVLEAIGAWLERHPNMEGLQATSFDKPSWGKVKYNDGKLFFIVEEEVKNNELILKGLVNEVVSVVEDGTDNDLQWEKKDTTLTIHLPEKFTEEVLPVIVVEVADEVEVIPSKTVHLEGTLQEIEKDSFYTGHGYHEEGNYNTMQQVIVRYSAFVHSDAGGKVSFVFHGEAVDDKTYKIIVGDEEKLVSGKEWKEKQVGPFTINANEVEEIRIVLAEAKHEGDPLHLDLQSVAMHFEKNK